MEGKQLCVCKEINDYLYVMEETEKTNHLWVLSVKKSEESSYFIDTMKPGKWTRLYLLISDTYQAPIYKNNLLNIVGRI